MVGFYEGSSSPFPGSPQLAIPTQVYADQLYSLDQVLITSAPVFDMNYFGPGGILGLVSYINSSHTVFSNFMSRALVSSTSSNKGGIIGSIFSSVFTLYNSYVSLFFSKTLIRFNISLKYFPASAINLEETNMASEPIGFTDSSSSVTEENVFYYFLSKKREDIKLNAIFAKGTSGPTRIKGLFP